MHTEKRDAPDTSKGYEVRDVNYKGLLRANVIFAAFAIGSAGVGYLLYHFWANPANYHNADKSVERMIPKDPFPLLQDNMTAKTDIMDMRQAEDHRLGDAPVQKEDGTYTIPIEAAKALVLDGSAPVSSSEELLLHVQAGQPTQNSDSAENSSNVETRTLELPSGTGGNH